MWECKFLMIIMDNFFKLSPSNGVESRHVHWKVSTYSFESLDMFIGKPRHIPWKVSICSLESLDIHWKKQGETKQLSEVVYQKALCGLRFPSSLGTSYDSICLFHHLRGNVIYLLHFPCKL